MTIQFSMFGMSLFYREIKKSQDLSRIIARREKPAGIGTEYVPAAYTSQGCPKCGHICKSNRNGLVFRCLSCGFQDNADRVGATNVALRSLLQRQAVEERAMCQLAYSSNIS